MYDRRRYHRLTLYYKILNGLTPSYLRQYIPEPAQQSYNTRKPRDTILARTLKFRYSFFPDVSNSWNCLSNFIKNSPSLDVFKKRFLEFFKVTQILFLVYTTLLALNISLGYDLALAICGRTNLNIILRILLAYFVLVKQTNPNMLNIFCCTALIICLYEASSFTTLVRLSVL